MSGPTTHVLGVIDMSGSMGALASDVRGGFNSYVDQLRADQAKGDSPSRLAVTVTLFDTEFVAYCTAADLDHVPVMTEENYRPRGATALLDAVGITVARFESEVTLGDEDRVMLVIQTDGHENSSREYTWKQISELLEAKAQTGGWTIVYLGQGVNAWSQGHMFGASTQVVNTSANARGTKASYTGLTTVTLAYAKGGDARTVGATLAATPGIKDDGAA